MNAYIVFTDSMDGYYVEGIYTNSTTVEETFEIGLIVDGNASNGWKELRTALNEQKHEHILYIEKYKRGCEINERFSNAISTATTTIGFRSIIIK